jgi:hypothetical protein
MIIQIGLYCLKGFRVDWMEFIIRGLGLKYQKIMIFTSSGSDAKEYNKKGGENFRRFARKTMNFLKIS